MERSSSSTAQLATTPALRPPPPARCPPETSRFISPRRIQPAHRAPPAARSLFRPSRREFSTTKSSIGPRIIPCCPPVRLSPIWSPDLVGRTCCCPRQTTPGPRSRVSAVRGLLPWPDFLNCITVYNEEDFRAYFENMLRMRFNTFGMHVYTGAEDAAESYLSFEFAGAGHRAFLDNSASQRWGYLPQRTSRYGMGAAQFY